MHAATPPAVFHAVQATLQYRKVGRKPHRSTRLAISLGGQGVYVTSLAMPATPDGNPLPPRRRKRIMSIPLLTFFTPIAPIRLFPGQNTVSHVPERDASRVSPLINGQISGQLFCLSPRSAVAFLATTGLGSRPKSRPALGLLASSQIRRFAALVGENEIRGFSLCDQNSWQDR